MVASGWFRLAHARYALQWSHRIPPLAWVSVTRPGSDVRALLAPLARDRAGMARLRAFLATETRDVTRLADVEVLDRVALRLTQGRALLLREPEQRDWPIATPEAEVREDSALGPAPEVTWIEIELLDERSHPVAGEPYRIELPDGTSRTGRLDDRGTARLQHIDPGTCRVSFPERDRGDFFPLDEDPRPWIEIALLEDDGTPVAGARYRVEVEGGETREGLLDARGFARCDGLAAETVKVSFPDYDRQDVREV
ncbi:MAG TPA: hypothetical protein VIF15_16040 [Polyangiaceae bacterium]|jgi:hypothetical protein